MKTKQLLILCIGIVLMYASTADAVTVAGPVTFVGTQYEVVHNGNYSARFWFRVIDSTCTGDNQPKERMISVVSGRMDDKFRHNMANFRNAYSTILSALITKMHVQIDGVPSCSNQQTQTIELWKARIGMH